MSAARPRREIAGFGRLVRHLPVTVLLALSLLSVGSRAQHRSTWEISAAPEPISLSARARKAAAAGVKEVQLTICCGDPMEISSMKRALEIHSVVLARVIDQQTILWRDRQVFTWYKLCLLKTLHRRPQAAAAGFRVGSLAEHPGDALPDALMPLQQGEFLMGREDGWVTVAGVTIRSTITDEPAFERGKTYLLFVVTDEAWQVAVPTMSAASIFVVSDRGEIRSNGDRDHPVVRDLRELHHNSLASLEQSLSEPSPPTLLLRP